MFWRKSRKPQVYLLTDDIAIGPQPQDSDLRAIHELGFRGVVDLRYEAQDCGDIMRAADFNYMRVAIVDGAAPTLEELHEISAWVAAHIQTSGPVLLHCREGRGRSATVAVACLVKLGLPLSEAYGILMRVRPNAFITTEQMQALEAFARSLDATTAA